MHQRPSLRAEAMHCSQVWNEHQGRPSLSAPPPLAQILMDEVESVDVDQSILGRLLGYGTVTVRGTGAGFEPLKRIAQPIELRNHIMRVARENPAVPQVPSSR